MPRHVDLIAVILITLGFVAINNARHIELIPPFAATGFHNAAADPCAGLDRALAELDSALQSIR